ncbi:Competence protein ComGC [Ewingella americana]|uniref:Competence protein ComGC n=1 Tax=Ewingella americana TaxID=41202 RepID=A0A377NIW5_9GAMM|nr:Competence protein ComGC [Ewingella americana]
MPRPFSCGRRDFSTDHHIGLIVHKFSRGFTLLEMLVVLVIIGLTMAFTVNIKQKNIEEIKQRQTAKLITREIYGLVKFIQQGQVSVIEKR